MPYLELTELRSDRPEAAGDRRVFIKVNGIAYTSPPAADPAGLIRIAPREVIDLTDLRAYPYGGIYFASRVNIRLYEAGADNDQDWFGDHVAEAAESENREGQAVTFERERGSYRLGFIVLPDDAAAHPVRGRVPQALADESPKDADAAPRHQRREKRNSKGGRDESR